MDFWNINKYPFLALSIISIFIPILMLKLGFSFKEVLIYNLVLHSTDVLGNFLAVKFLKKYGLKWNFIFATILVISYFILYLFLDAKNWNLLIFMAIIWAIYDAFYYTTYYYGLIANTQKVENVKNNNIIVNIFSSISGFLGPLTASAIIFFSENQNILLAVTILFFSLSLIPLFKYKKLEKPKINLKNDFLNFFSLERNKKNFISWSFYSILRAMEGIILPIFIYLEFKTLDSIAWLSLISIFTTILATYFSGKIKIENREKSIIIASIILIIIWLTRIYFSNNLWLYFSTLLGGIAMIFIFIPLDTSIFRQSKIDKNESLIGFLKNTLSMFSKLILFILIFFIFEKINFKSLFWFSIISLLIIIFVNLRYMRLKEKKLV